MINREEASNANEHIGFRISEARKLMGLTKKELSNRLGVPEQDISKLEQREYITDELLQKVANALGVSFQGLKNFQSSRNMYCINNFYENCGVIATNGGILGTARVENVNYFSVDQTMQLFDELVNRGYLIKK